MQHVKSTIYSMYLLLSLFGLMAIAHIIPENILIAPFSSAWTGLAVFFGALIISMLAILGFIFWGSNLFVAVISLGILFPVGFFATAYYSFAYYEINVLLSLVRNLFSMYTLFSFLIAAGLLLLCHLFNAALKENSINLARYLIVLVFIGLFYLADWLLSIPYGFELPEEALNVGYNSLLSGIGTGLTIYALIFPAIFEVVEDIQYSSSKSLLSVTASVIKRI